MSAWHQTPNKHEQLMNLYRRFRFALSKMSLFATYRTRIKSGNKNRRNETSWGRGGGAGVGATAISSAELVFHLHRRKSPNKITESGDGRVTKTYV